MIEGLLKSLLSNVFIKTFVIKALTSVGIGVVVYQGLDRVMSYLTDSVKDILSGSEASNLLGLLGADIYINYIVSAYITLFSIAAFTKFTKK